MATSAKTAFDALNAAKSNPYVKQIIEDEELRAAVRGAFESARDAYSRLNSGKPPQRVVFDDKKFHRDIKRAAEALGDVGSSLRQGTKRRRKGSLGRKLLFLLVLGVAALVLSSTVRDKVLDLLFGKEEEFDYMSTTAPVSTPASETTHA